MAGFEVITEDGGFGKLLGVHFAETFVALHGSVALAFVFDVVQQVDPVGLLPQGDSISQLYK